MPRHSLAGPTSSLARLIDQSQLIQIIDERGRCQEATLWMLPSHQCLSADEFACAKGILRLIEVDELARAQGHFKIVIPISSALQNAQNPHEHW